jgi:hypothetical protein
MITFDITDGQFPDDQPLPDKAFNALTEAMLAELADVITRPMPAC